MADEKILEEIENEILGTQTLMHTYQNKVNVLSENLEKLYIVRGQIQGHLAKAGETTDVSRFMKRAASANTGITPVIEKTLRDFGNPCSSDKLFEMVNQAIPEPITKEQLSRGLSYLCNDTKPGKVVALTNEGEVTKNPHYKPRYYALAEWVDGELLKQQHKIQL